MGFLKGAQVVHVVGEEALDVHAPEAAVGLLLGEPFELHRGPDLVGVADPRRAGSEDQKCVVKSIKTDRGDVDGYARPLPVEVCYTEKAGVVVRGLAALKNAAYPRRRKKSLP